MAGWDIRRKSPSLERKSWDPLFLQLGRASPARRLTWYPTAGADSGARDNNEFASIPDEIGDVLEERSFAGVDRAYGHAGVLEIP